MIDKLILSYEYVKDDDLNICVNNGVAYQHDVTYKKDYDGKYFEYCQTKYFDTNKKALINAKRWNFIFQTVGSTADNILDIGIGDGSFMTHFGRAKGYDVDEMAVEWLKENNLFADDLSQFKYYTMWDVIEHIENPDEYLQYLYTDNYLFLSLPIFEDLNKIRNSKHYRPGEHFYYFTKNGLIAWMKEKGFELRNIGDFEIHAGRESIYDFAFMKK